MLLLLLWHTMLHFALPRAPIQIVIPAQEQIHMGMEQHIHIFDQLEQVMPLEVLDQHFRMKPVCIHSPYSIGNIVVRAVAPAEKLPHLSRSVKNNMILGTAFAVLPAHPGLRITGINDEKIKLVQIFSQSHNAAVIFEMGVVKALSPEYQQLVGSSRQYLGHICRKRFEIPVLHQKYGIKIRVSVLSSPGGRTVMPAALAALIALQYVHNFTERRYQILMHKHSSLPGI
ncbi:hypothetical protein D3C81_1547840 [compost metagenome]